MPELATVPSEASSGATLDGSGWLSNLLKTGIAGYVAVQTVKAQNRTTTPGAVTTDDPLRVAQPAAAPIAPRTWLIAGGLLVGALLLILFFRRK